MEEDMIPGIPDVAVGATLAALIAGIVSLLGLIVAKENKVSEFRQAWIDELREEIASFVAHANAIQSSSETNWPNKQDAWKDVRGDFVSLNEATGKIRLRLNTEEGPSQTILNTIEDIEKHFAPTTKPAGSQELNTLEKRLVTETSIVLKSEWNRVKAGERVYQFSKYAASIVVLVILLGGGYLAWRAPTVATALVSPPPVVSGPLPKASP